MPVIAPPETAAVKVAPAPGPSIVVTPASSNAKINSNLCKVNPFVWYVFFSTLLTLALTVFVIETVPVVSLYLRSIFLPSNVSGSKLPPPCSAS